jgi:hypothetical protein
MKKSILLALGGIIIFTGCKKTDNKNANLASDRLSLIPFTSCNINKIKYDNLFDNCSDLSERKIDQAQYSTVKSILGLSNNPNFLKIISKAKNSDDNCVSLTEIASLLEGGQNGNFNISDCPYEHNGFYYKPVLYVANANHADFTLTPIMSPGIELYDEVNDEYENHDVIFGWFVSENNDTIEINIGDYDYSHTRRPIVVASLTLCPGQDEKIQSLQYSNSDMQRRTSFNPKIDGLQVNHRYDQTNYSEVWISGIEVNNKQVTNTLLFKLSDVHRSNIGKFSAFGIAKSMGFFQVTSSFNERMCFNLFEYDWYASPKYLGHCYLKGMSSGNSYSLYRGNRKFYEEWYAYPPGDLSPYEIPTASLTTRGTIFTWNKGAISITK